MKFVVVDVSKTIAVADLVAYAGAQETQLRQHYAAAYDGDALSDEVRVATDITPARSDEFELRLEPVAPDGPDGAALGVHDLRAGYCYLDLAAQYGDAWQAILSHECLEARADRRLHACIELDDGTIIDKEIADRVEADTYLIDGIPMSSFNTPACFEPSGPPGSERYDWLGLSTHPNEIRPGGYAQVYTIDRGWQIVEHPDVGMRSYRRELAKRGLSRGAKRKARTK